MADNKASLRKYVEANHIAGVAGVEEAANQFFADDVQICMVHPFNELSGVAEYKLCFLAGISSSFEHLRRYDYIAFAGQSEGDDWVTCTGYYSGHFAKPWLGIQATNTIANLRFGEFHRMHDGQAIESFIFLDIPELMIAANQWPIKDSPGNERGFIGYLPGPQALDGLQWQANDPERSASSCEMVTQMLRSLATEDEAWRPFWHQDMRWYGPAAFGSFIGLENFAGFQRPFEQTFSEWIGGSVPGSQTKHFARFADGDYICSGGWPSINAVQVKPFLEQSPEGKRLFMRVCDWWRREDDLLLENWVFVDIPHVLLQMGYDVLSQLDTNPDRI